MKTEGSDWPLTAMCIILLMFLVAVAPWVRDRINAKVTADQSVAQSLHDISENVQWMNLQSQNQNQTRKKR